MVAGDIRSPPTKRNLLAGARVADLSNELQTCATLPLKSENAGTASHCPNATDLWSPALLSALDESKPHRCTRGLVECFCPSQGCAQVTYQVGDMESNEILETLHDAAVLFALTGFGQLQVSRNDRGPVGGQ